MRLLTNAVYLTIMCAFAYRYRKEIGLTDLFSDMQRTELMAKVRDGGWLQTTPVPDVFRRAFED